MRVAKSLSSQLSRTFFSKTSKRSSKRGNDSKNTEKKFKFNQNLNSKNIGVFSSDIPLS